MLAQDEPGVRALVALDSLKRFAHGDPAAAIGCTGSRAAPVTPLVPALGARRVIGVPTRRLLSTTFRSAAYLPASVDCEDYLRCLRQDQSDDARLAGSGTS